MIKALLVSATLVGAIALPATAFAKPNSSRSEVIGPTTNQTNANGYRGPNHSFVSVTQEYEKGIRQYKKGNYHLAKVAFRNVLTARQEKNYSQSIVYLGLIAAKRDDHERAIKLYLWALRGNPNVYGLKAVLGLSYVELGEVKKAKAILADMKRKQHRHYENGSNEAEVLSSIEVLEKALSAVTTT